MMVTMRRTNLLYAETESQDGDDEEDVNEEETEDDCVPQFFQLGSDFRLLFLVGVERIEIDADEVVPELRLFLKYRLNKST